MGRTDADLFLCEENVYSVNVSHELSISEGEVGHVSPGLGGSHELNQS